MFRIPSNEIWRREDSNRIILKHFYGLYLLKARSACDTVKRRRVMADDRYRVCFKV